MNNEQTAAASEEQQIPTEANDDWDLGVRTCSLNPEECESCQ